MVEVFARIARFLIAALLACVATATSIVPVKAVPIARGLPALGMMLEKTSPQNAEPIFIAQSDSKCGSPTTSINPLKLSLLAIGADDTFDLSGREAQMQERRENDGSRVLESANLPKSSIVACVVRQETKVGARIEVPSTFDVPETFNMTFDGGRSIRPCRLVWRSFNEVAVEFL